MSLLNKKAKEEASTAAAIEEQAAALVLESSDECPECAKPMINVTGAGLPMKCCIACRIALPARTATENEE